LGSGSIDMTVPSFTLAADLEQDTRDVLLIAKELAVSTEQSFKNFLLVNFFDMIYPSRK
jgi:hypothetical protein